MVLLGAALAGCAGDECESGQSACVDGSTVRRCVGDRDGHAVQYVWQEQDCPAINDHCVTREDAAGTAVCASSPERSPLCAGGDFCADDIEYECVDGYAVVHLLCANGCATTKCAP